MRSIKFLALLAMASPTVAQTRYVMYLTGQHPIVPAPSLVSQITHVTLAFMPSSLFNSPTPPSSFPLFMTVKEARSKFAERTKIMVAIGGWGDTEGFEIAARSEQSMLVWAENVKVMVEATGADGVDVDWEYPGGNGEDYKINLNPTKAWQIEAYPIFLSTLRKVLGPSLLISAAVPGLPTDTLAFTPHTGPLISSSLDFLNLMTYDLMNRRSSTLTHHTSLSASLLTVTTYITLGFPPSQLNLGFAFYVKWFKTLLPLPSSCAGNPISCKTVFMEDPHTGADLGLCGAFSYHDDVPRELVRSWERAKKGGVYGEEEGGHYFWDGDEGIWWSWDTEEAIERKVREVVGERGLAGVFAWGLGEDAGEWKHLEALNRGVERLGGEGGGRGGDAVGRGGDGIRRCKDTEGLEKFYRDTVQRFEL